MANTDISMCSNALLLLGANTISSFTEAGAGAEVAANLYEKTYESLITKHPWRFAVGKVSLSKLVDAPLNEYQYAYQLPANYLTAIKVFPFSDYEIFEDKLYSNLDGIELDYMFKPSESKLPPYFIELMEFRLASKFAIPVTGNRSLAETYGQAFNDQLVQAQFYDSKARPNVAITHSPFIDARQ